ncbi:hypothetical protein HDZ31DRAFT_63007 [Schizophyllum fasciatum]
MVKTDIAGAAQIIANLNEKETKAKWQNLAEAVDKLRAAAEIPSTRAAYASFISLDDLAEQLRRQACQ